MLAATGLVPKSVVEATLSFMSDWGFLDFYIAALICGSILGINRKLLVKASAKFIPVALLSMVVGFFATGAVGALLCHSVMYISFAQMAGGMGAGIVPLSKIYAAGLHTDASSILSQLAPATTLGNIFAIIGAIVLARGFANTKFNGHGVLIPVDKDDLKKSTVTLDPTKIGVGMMIAFALFFVGVIFERFGS